MKSDGVSGGATDPSAHYEHLLVERLPVRSDLLLDAAKSHRPVADEVGAMDSVYVRDPTRT